VTSSLFFEHGNMQIEKYITFMQYSELVVKMQ